MTLEKPWDALRNIVVGSSDSSGGTTNYDIS